MAIDYSVTLLFYVEGEPIPNFAENLAQRAGAVSIFPDGQSFEITLTVTDAKDDYHKYMDPLAYATDNAIDEIYIIALTSIDDFRPLPSGWAKSVIHVVSTHAMRSDDNQLIENILKGRNWND